MIPFQWLQSDSELVESSTGTIDHNRLHLPNYRQRATVRLLMAADRMSVDSSPLIEALAAEQRLGKRKKLRQLSKLLRSDVSSIDALEQTSGAIESYGVDAIRMASETGIRQLVARSLVEAESIHARQSQLQANRSLNQVPLLVGQCFVIAALIFFLSWIMASSPWVFFDEFELTAPFWASQLEQWKAPLFFGVLALAGLLICVRIAVTSGWVHRIKTRINQHFFPQSQSAALLSLFSNLSRAGRPLIASVETLSKYHSHAQMRSRLSEVRKLCEDGHSLWQALAQTNVLTSVECHALDIAPSGPATTWLLHHFTNVRLGKPSVSKWWLLSAMSFGVLMILAAIVLFVAVGTLETLYELTRSLA